MNLSKAQGYSFDGLMFCCLQRFDAEGELKDDTKQVTINVKPGWKKGTKITFPNEGDEATGIIPADIVFVITEKAHQHYTREGNDMIYTARLPLDDALSDCRST